MGQKEQKNVKISEATHRKLRIKAAELGTQVGMLAETLIDAALSNMDEDHIRAWLNKTVTGNGNS